jgi:spermidine synthase
MRRLSPVDAERSARMLVALCFFLSGAAGILFETVWARAFGLILGNTLEGISLVVGLFLGGLGAGAALATLFVGRLADPVKVYAWVEGGIGLWGLTGILLLPRLPGVLAALFPSSGSESALLSAGRTLAALLFLAPPTLLMGMTLPLLSEGLTRSGRFLSSLGLLYGVNTVGATAGAAFGGFLLLPRIGGAWTMTAAAGFDFAILLMAGALLAARPLAAAAPEETAAPPRPSQAPRRGAEGSGAAPPPEALLCAVFTATGAIALLSEIAWTRALSLVLGSSTYTFSLILTVFLLGGGAGSLLWRLARREPRDPVKTYGLLWVLFGLGLLLSIVLLDHATGIYLRLYAATCSSRALIVGGLFLVAAAVVFPPAVLLGLHFPLTGAIFHSRGGSPGRAAGRAFLWNSVGALAGSLATGFLLLPALGTAGTLRWAAAASLLLGGGLAAWRMPWKAELRLAAAVVVLALCLVAVAAGPGLDTLLREQGIYRQVSPEAARNLPRAEFVERARNFGNRQCLFLQEGRLSTVAVWHSWTNLSLTVGGKADASLWDMETQALVGHIPMLFHRSPRSVFVVGYGSGITAEAVLTHAPSSVDVAEIEPAVLRAAERFRPWTPLAAAGRGVRVLREDGRAALTYGRDRYDVIISEPSNPWIAGVNALFTEEFYRIVRSHLNEGGVFCQWVQVYEMSAETQNAIFRALRAVFPDFVVFEAGDDLICLAGRDAAPRLDPAAWEAKRSGPVSASLESIGVFTLEDLFAHSVNDASMVPAGKEKNTDDNGRVEFRAPWEMPAFLPSLKAVQPEDLRTADPVSLWTKIGWQGPSPERVARGAVSALLQGKPLLARRLFDALRASGSAPPPDLDGQVRAVETLFQRAREAGLPQYVRSMLEQSEQLMAQGRYEEAAAWLSDAGELAPRNAEILARHVECLSALRRPGEVASLAKRHLRRGYWNTRYEALYDLASADFAMGDGPSGESALRAAIATDPYRDPAYLLLADYLARAGRRGEALGCVTQGLSFQPDSRSLRELSRSLSGE